MIMLHDEGSMREEIRGYLNSHEWWMLIPLTRKSRGQVTFIEETFYADEANEDFVALMGGFGQKNGVGALYFAKKPRMSPAQLSDISDQDIPDARRDIIALIDGPEQADASATWLSTFEEWLGPIEGPL